MMKEKINDRTYVKMWILKNTLRNHLHVDIQSNETSNTTCNINPKIWSIAKYKGNDNNEWKTAKILSRGGKARGKYSTFYIEDCVTWETMFDFKNLK